jgi:hypothetical protein
MAGEEIAWKSLDEWHFNASNDPVELLRLEMAVDLGDSSAGVAQELLDGIQAHAILG